MSDPLLDVGVEAVRRGLAVLAGRDVAEVGTKGDRDLVTDLDRAVEDTVRAFLADETPELGFLGEESGGDPGGRRWVLDPVDGTVNMVHGLPLTAVALALLDGDDTTLGVITAPASGTWWTGTAGGGAHVDGVALRASGATEPRRALVAYGGFATGEGAEAENAERLDLVARLVPRVERLRTFGSACLELAWLAQGSLDAVVLFGNHPWDTAAGVLLAREAGAVVLDRAGAPHTVGSATCVGYAPGVVEALAPLIAPGS